MFRHRKRGSTFVARSVSPQLLQGRRKSGDYAAPSGLGSLIESQTQGVALGCIILPLQGKDRTVCTRATNPADLWVRMRALPLDPGFFPSTERGTTELETEDTTLITAGT